MYPPCATCGVRLVLTFWAENGMCPVFTIRFWRFNRQRYILTGEQCTNCSELFLAPRTICPQCHSKVEKVARDILPNLAVKEPLTVDEWLGAFPVGALRVGCGICRGSLGSTPPRFPTRAAVAD